MSGASGPLVLLLAVLCWFLPATAHATPIYSVRAASRCDTCHIEPTNWENPDHSKRKCSLDCAVCHTSPQGGGLRTPAGQYYGEEVLPRWGHRPGSTVPDDKYATEAHPVTQGWYRILPGFTGWVAGELPSSSIPDRYGDIDPDPRVNVGFDGRLMLYDALRDPDLSIFPMQVEGYLDARLVEKIRAYVDVGLSSDRSSLDVARGDDPTGVSHRLVDYLAVREVYVMADRFDDRAYVRAGRISPIYGWRLPDHTVYTRRDLGFDVQRQVFGVEAGWNRSYPYVNGSAFVEGLDAWPGDRSDPGKGWTLNAGYRDLGWQAGLSHQQVFRADRSETLVGPTWGLMLYPVTLLGEADWRHTATVGGDPADTLATYAELNWQVQWGITAKLYHEWFDADTAIDGDHRNRFALGAEFHPWTGVQLEPSYRLTLLDGGFGLSGGRYPGAFVYDSRQLVFHEWMVQAHVWF